MLIATLLCAAWSTVPADEVRLAAADLARRAPDRQPTTRYATFFNLPLGERAAAAAVLSYVLNAVSRTSVIVVPERLAAGRVVCFDLRDYGLPSEAWEALVASGEPYFHLTTTVLPPGATPGNTPPQIVQTDGGWIDLPAAARLRQLSGSRGAVVRGDWLIAKASVPPFYHVLADVAETRDGWYRQLGIDPAVIVDLQANRGANLFRSGVTRQVRRLSRWQGPHGGAWQTYDVSASVPGKDPFRDPTFDGRGFQFEASELIAAKANGLHLFGLYDAAGRRQDAVPDRIAKDDSDPAGEGIIVPMLSCVRCHTQSGLLGFSNDQRRLLAGGVELYTESPDLAQRLAAFYGSPRLERDLDRDRSDYEHAVRQTTGMAADDLANALGQFYRQYVYEPVSPVTAARELAVSEAALCRRLRSADDPALLALAEGLSIQRQQWEASFAQAALLLAE